MTDPRLTPLAQRLPATVPFVGPEAQERSLGRSFTARLGANESVFGPSPHAAAAMAGAAREAWQYADPEAHDLRRAIAAHHDCPAEHIHVGEGIDGILGNLVRLTVTHGTPVVTSAGAYPTFNYHVAGFGGALHTVPYTGDYEDPDRLIARAREVSARLIYLANPDNPMGTVHDAETIERMMTAVPEGAILVLDEAYVEFGPTPPALDPTDRRVIRMRTFSKAHGMAGARVGYAIGDAALVSAFNKVRNHFGLNRIAQAGALAALADREHLAQVVARVAAARERIVAIAAETGLAALPSATNFVPIDCGGDGNLAARIRDALAARGVFVRMPFVAPQTRCIRVTCGTDADLGAFAAALPQALAEARNP